MEDRNWSGSPVSGTSDKGYRDNSSNNAANLDAASAPVDCQPAPEREVDPRDLRRCVDFGGCPAPESCLFNLPCWGGGDRADFLPSPRVVAVRVEGRMYVRQVVEGIPTRVEVLHAPRGLAAVVRFALECAGLSGVA